MMLTARKVRLNRFCCQKALANIQFYSCRAVQFSPNYAKTVYHVSALEEWRKRKIERARRRGIGKDATVSQT